MEMDQAARRAAMERLDALIGDWTLEASFSSAPGSTNCAS